MAKQLRRRIGDFLRREDGPTAVEYAVMLALIIAVCLAAVSALGANVNQAFGQVAATMGGKTPSWVP